MLTVLLGHYLLNLSQHPVLQLLLQCMMPLMMHLLLLMLRRRYCDR